jgi:hypothetical protein
VRTLVEGALRPHTEQIQLLIAGKLWGEIPVTGFFLIKRSHNSIILCKMYHLKIYSVGENRKTKKKKSAASV